MRFTEVAADAFQKIALNAGVLLDEFDPANPGNKTTMRTHIMAATSGGLNVSLVPTFTDFGEDIDNVPNKTKELQKEDRFDVSVSGTAVTVDEKFAARLIGMAETETTGTLSEITPRADVLQTDFKDIWWVSDYSDENGPTKGGFVAAHIMNALSTGGLVIQSVKDGKVTFAFTFTGHYSMEDVQNVPFRFYVNKGAAEPPVTP